MHFQKQIFRNIEKKGLHAYLHWENIYFWFYMDGKYIQFFRNLEQRKHLEFTNGPNILLKYHSKISDAMKIVVETCLPQGILVCHRLRHRKKNWWWRKRTAGDVGAHERHNSVSHRNTGTLRHLVHYNFWSFLTQKVAVLATGYQSKAAENIPTPCQYFFLR